jgi:predicted TPR repeat methyltransferase
MPEQYKVSVDDALTMAMELHKTGELIEAKSIYGKVLSAVPNHPDALHFLGVTLHQLGESEEAVRQVERSLEMAPDNPAAINNLGNILRETGRLEEAETAYLKVLGLAPDHPSTLVNLGIILREKGHPENALEYLKRALSLEPDNAVAYHNLGNVYRQLDRIDDAINAFRRAGELSADDEKSTLAMADVLHKAGKVREAQQALEDLLRRYPGNPSATHFLAAFTGENVPARASDQYVRQLFDKFAPSFDEALSRLDYKAPRLVADKVVESLGKSGSKYRVLDIGCGTGLCGPLVKPVAETLTGVDLSAGMLKKAKGRAVYDRLEEAELTKFMQSADNDFDVITCVDTFVYFGDLADALRAAHGALSEQGWLFFTVERHTEQECAEAYRLQHHGRYSHRKAYIDETLTRAGFLVRELGNVALRNESKKPVKGILVVAQRS